MSYHELKERLEKLYSTEFAENPDERLYELEDLAEDILVTLRNTEHAFYLSKRSVPPEISSFYPIITKDPTISCFKDNHLVFTQSLDNPDFAKLRELGLYVLRYSLFGDSDYCIRTTEQLEYISKFLEGEMRQVVGLKDYHFYINFD